MPGSNALKGEVLEGVDPREMTRRKGSRPTHVEHKLPEVKSGIIQLVQSGVTTDDQEQLEAAVLARREKYAPMKAHQEKAAMALAVGANSQMAGRFAGVSSRQVRKYMMSIDFRNRVEELRSILNQKILGRIMAELDRRTKGKSLQQMEIMDVLRIMDRMTGMSQAKMQAGALNGLEGAEKYDALFQQIINVNGPTQSSDFPIYGVDDVRVPSESPSGD